MKNLLILCVALLGLCTGALCSVVPADEWRDTWKMDSTAESLQLFPGTIQLDHTGTFINTVPGGNPDSVIKGSWRLSGDTLWLSSAQWDTTQYALARALDRRALSLQTAAGQITWLRSAVYKPEAYDWTSIPRGMIGILGLLFICWLASNNRRHINWRLVASGIGLQILLGALILHMPLVKDLFEGVSGAFVELLKFTEAGTKFLFTDKLGAYTDSFGVIFAFQILPVIVFFSALTSLLYYFGILQKIVMGFAWLLSKVMKLSGAESVSAAGNIFLGQTEAPLLIKPYLPNMNRSELLTVMVGGMATIAGSVFAAYVGFLGGNSPEEKARFAMHLLTASVMAAPAGLVAAKMLFPQTEEIDANLSVSKEKLGANVLDAVSNGTTEGLKLAVNVGAMLLVFIAFIAMFNYLIGDLLGAKTGLNLWVEEFTNGRMEKFSLEFIFGILFAPIAWLLGVPGDDVLQVGRLLGEKTVLNEFIAYTSLASVKSEGLFMYNKSIIISTYALCGFANFSSIGIQIGGIGTLAPGKRETIARLGLRALLGGTIATFLSATVAGMLTGF